MKNLYKIIFITLLLVGSNAMEAYCKYVLKVKIARARDCRGFGLCAMVIWIDDSYEGAENEVRATADINNDKRLTLTFNKNVDLPPQVFEKYFSNGFFICEDDYSVPAEILKLLKLNDEYIVPAGKYPITIQNDLVTVVF